MSIKQTFKRSFYKTMTWRVIASLDTALLTWLFSGNLVTGLKVGGMEIVTKLIIYFLKFVNGLQSLKILLKIPFITYFLRIRIFHLKVYYKKINPLEF